MFRLIYIGLPICFADTDILVQLDIGDNIRISFLDICYIGRGLRGGGKINPNASISIMTKLLDGNML